MRRYRETDRLMMRIGERLTVSARDHQKSIAPAVKGTSETRSVSLMRGAE
jgi:hypothetical protein